MSSCNLEDGGNGRSAESQRVRPILAEVRFVYAAYYRLCVDCSQFSGNHEDWLATDGISVGSRADEIAGELRLINARRAALGLRTIEIVNNPATRP